MVEEVAELLDWSATKISRLERERSLIWVHVAETDSFLPAHARFGGQPLDQVGRERFVADIDRIGAGLGVPDPSRAEAEPPARINACRPELAVTAQASDAAPFLLLRPLPVIAPAPRAVLAAAEVSLLPGRPRRLARSAGHTMVHTIRWAITPGYLAKPPPLPLTLFATRRGMPAMATPIADSAPLSAVEWAAVTNRRSASSGLLPRDQMRAWMSAAKAVGCVPVGVLGWTG